MTGSEPTSRRRPHVVVVGGGFGGLSTVHALRHADVDVTLVDRHTYNVFQPLLYQVATATLNPGDITFFLRSVQARQPNLHFVQGTVLEMDHEARTLHLDNGAVVAYDRLVIAAGVTANFFGISGAQEHALPLYTRAQALTMRDAIFTRLEQAAATGQERDLRIVVVGGGPTGVETAGALAELRNEDLSATYPELDPRRTHITLVEMLPTVLAPFREDLQAYTRRALERRGVDVRVGTAVKEVREDGVVVGEEETFLPAGIVVWASGVTVHDTVSSWGLPQGKGGRVVVDDRLRVAGLEGVYAIGDIAAEEGERALPQLAQPAIQAGRYVARQIRARLEGRDVDPFHYRDKGTLATIGRSSAVGEIPHLPALTGLPAWTVWTGVHVANLLGNRNRLATMVNLGARYVFWRRGHNVIVGEIPTPLIDGVRPAGSGDEPTPRP
jgi:NADH dehydrogenase